jgi:hypothetical protein
MLLSLRNPTIMLTTYVIQLVAYPVGLGWDLIFPDRVLTLFGIKFNLKPGPFNFKEHVIIVVMSNVGCACPRVLERSAVPVCASTLRYADTEARLHMAAVRCTRPM